MENRLRKICKYYFGIIIILFAFWIYRLPHTEDYKYDEYKIWAKIKVIDSALQILEVDLSKRAYAENEYFIFKSPSFSYKISAEDGFRRFDRGDARSYNTSAEIELAYYSFSEDVIYDAQVPQAILEEIKAETMKTKAKSRYYRYYYSVHKQGKIELEVLEEYSGSSNEGKPDKFIYAGSYQAKRIEITPQLRSELEKYFPFPSSRWDEMK